MRVAGSLLLGILGLFPILSIGAAGGLRGEAGAAPSGDPRDRLLLERALRIGKTVATKHTSPEGLLAYIHRRGATPAQLSHDALSKADTGIWTGCYAASLACRYGVTHDPDALRECRRVAAGLDLLSAATGVEGAVSRAVGRPLPGEPLPKHARSCPSGAGLYYRDDPSRDTLSGIVLGWECLARFVDDPEVHAFAARNLLAIATRLYGGGMQLRDVDGKVTTHGALHPTAALGLVEVGEHASIGLATMLAGARWGGGDDMWRAWRKLDKEGWVDALDDQNLWVNTFKSQASDWNMVHLALLVIALEGEGKPKRHVMAALREMRRKTAGWENGSYLACSLLAGQQVDRADSVEELREALLSMPPEDGPFRGTETVKRSGVVPLARRPVNEWAWKQRATVEEVGREGAALDPAVTFTRADFLFAYWLARAAGELDPGPDVAPAGRR